ncbi:YqgQ family protein [Paludifilum halophilum]|uniref:Cytosolic protein n=1 Tax=Paludifilum halophilum TaxID=1642702 RepID=A0A235BA92_9BACL|nr:YqgQ family protein [Paludifilum halophilum]OYD09186.1 hypothetical protein CHM34_04590 [Paludifilum halophilum]
MEVLRGMTGIHRLLNRFGTVIYTGDRLGDLEMMEDEVEELYRAGMIDRETHLTARRILSREKKEIRS